MRAAAVLIVASSLLCTAESAAAQSCSGVEARVVGRTSALGIIVQGTIQTTQSALLAQEALQQQQLVSAMRVLTKQSSTSSDQVTTTLQASSQAVASTLIAQDQNQAVADATQRYSSIGFDPCGADDKAQALFLASQQTAATRKQLAATPQSVGAWSAGVAGATNLSATSIFAGDTAAAAQFINAVVGPPAVAPTGTSAEADLARVNNARRESNRSLVANILADTAADYAPNGPVAMARELSSHWIADDGGEAWAAASAGEATRGILQDAVRQEAANLAQLALDIQTGVRTEAAAAAALLAMVNARIGAQSALGQLAMQKVPN